MSPAPSDGSVEGPAPPKERRFKLSRACDRCRRRRIKCDEGHPCQSCLSSHSPCTFEEHGKRAHHAKSKRTATLEERMLHLETLIQAIPTNIFDSPSYRNGLDSLQSPIDEPSSPNGPPPYPIGVPPPSLSVSTLTNPSTHFSPPTMPISFTSAFGYNTTDKLAQNNSRPSLSHSYMYFDEQGCKRWQGETSGLPLLDLLFEQSSAASRGDWSSVPPSPLEPDDNASGPQWFPDRVTKNIDINPETLWKVITSCISPDLMDTLVQCYLSTSYYLMPFLHVPSFLADYGNPMKWGEPGFASFILSVCCLSSRHIDDPRVRSDVSDPLSVGARWFELFSRLRTLPTADRPTLYTVQAVLVAAVYALGLGKLSKAFALLSEAVTLSFDAGLHRSVEAYDCFDPIEGEVRKRTFWCVYMWDKQAGAAFGRPSLLRLRDCDVQEPAVVDDEFITAEGVGLQPSGAESRMGAFVATIRYYVVLESVLDIPPTPSGSSSSPFLARASTILSRFRRNTHMREEDMVLDELRRKLPTHWVHTPETMLNDDVIRITQTVRLHCLERFISLLIHRHRFSNFVAQRSLGHPDTEPCPEEKDALKACYVCAREIVAAHMHTATKGLMTYYGVQVIHQLTQAGRTLVAVVLSAKTDDLQHLIIPSLDVLRSCVGLLRRFSGHYVCGLRNGDLLEEFCRLSQIPLDAPPSRESTRSHPPWLRPVKKRHRTSSAPCSTASNDSHETHDFLDIPAATPHSRSLSPSSPDGSFVPSAADVDMSMHYHHPVVPHVSSSIGAPDVFHTNMNGELSHAGLVALFQEGNFDVSALFPPTAMFPTASQLGTGANDRDLGIIATPSPLD